MGGLRALCCSKGDKADDCQHPPARPAQQRPEKSTQNAPPNANKETPSTDVTPKNLTPGEPAQENLVHQNLIPRDLWKEAFENLDPSRQPYVAANGMSCTSAIDQVIQDTTAKYEQWQKGGLRIRRKDGDDINLRDCAERILGAAMKASNIISTAVSFDPTGHASSAWMVISFGMSIVQNRLDRRDAIFAASEYLAETLSYYILIDTNYRNQKVSTDHNLDKALVRVYTAILDFTVEVKKGRDENEAKRTFQSVLALTDQPLQIMKDVINSESELAKKWTELAANLGDRKRAAEHLAKTDALLANMKHLASKALTAEEESQLVWMSAFPYSDRQRALQKKRSGDTGLWLLDAPEYNDWKRAPGGLLWLRGISGCGKSVLCSTLIQDIGEDCSLDPSKFLVYWYFQFDSDATKNIDTMSRSLIRQLSRSPLAPEVIKIWEEHHLKGSQPDSKAISCVLHSLLSAIRGEIYLVLDALDECPENEESKERGSLLLLLEDLLKRHSTKIHILATSRPEPDIQQKLEPFSKIDLEAHLAEDVKTFVTISLAQNPLKRWKTDIHDLILDELLNSKERRFRWAELQIMALERCRNDRQIKYALKTIPQTLEASYRKVLESIDSNDVLLAREILMIICLSPILFDAQTVADMVELSFPEAIIEICTTSFVNIIDEKVQLSHFSVQEFLVVKEESSQHHPCQFSAANGHMYLAEKTLDILLEQTEILTQLDAKNNMPFLYAAKHWNTHVTDAGGINALSPELQTKINRLFSESNVYFNWVRAADSDDRNVDNEWSKLLQECQPPIHRASIMGLVQSVDYLLAQGADPLQVFAYGIFSGIEKDTFTLAASEGQLDVLHTLLNKGLPLERDVVKSIVGRLDYRTAGKVKLASLLETMWDRGLLRKHSADTTDEIDEAIAIFTMINQVSCKAMMDVFLSWEPRVSLPMTDDVILVATCWNIQALQTLIERSDFRVPATFLERLRELAYRYGRSRTEGLGLIATRRPNELPIDSDLFEKFVKELDFETLKSLMQVRASDVRVTESVLEKAAENQNSGRIFRLLWPQRESGIVIKESMLRHAFANRHVEEIVSFMQENIKSDMNLSEETIDTLLSTAEAGVTCFKLLQSLSTHGFSVSERHIETICCHKDAIDMLSLLVVEEGFNIPITDGIISSAASNTSQGPAVLKYLGKLYQKPLPVTESVIVSAVKNQEHGEEILGMLLQDTSSLLLTDKVFEEACGNPGALVVLLGRKQNDLPIAKMIARMAEISFSAREILQILLERNLLKINESVVETLAANFYTLDLLLSLEPDSPITEKALSAGANDARSMRVMLGARGSTLHVTENVLKAAARSMSGEDVMTVIQNRQGSLNITENVIREAINNELPHLVTWLLEQCSESFVRAFFQDNWRALDFDSHARCAILEGFLKKTGSRITESLLQDWPFDPETGENYGLDSITNRRDKIFELPATEPAAEVFVERCDIDFIENFWGNKQIPVTDLLIQAVERNRVANKEVLKVYLEQKRGGLSGDS